MPAPFTATLLSLTLLCVAAPIARADVSFSNPAPITIPDNDTGGMAIPATPYPAEISVAGVTGSVTRAKVTLHGFHHMCAQDVDVLLQGPTGADSLLMSDAGDCHSGVTAAPIDLTFDSAPAPKVPCLTGGSGFAGGDYTPADYEDHDCVNPGDFPDTFPDPAPAGPWPASLSGFLGANPNGTWKLYVVDDQGGDGGAIDGGWGLAFATSSASSGGGNGGGGGTPTTTTTSPPKPRLPAPSFSLHPSKTQRVGRSGALVLSFATNTPGTLVATGTVSVPGKAAVYKLRGSRRKLAPGKATVKLKLTHRALKAVKRALKAHRRVSAKVTLSFTGTDGARTVRRAKVRLK